MFLLNWYNQYLEIKNQYLEKQCELKYCESCEILKTQLAITNDEKRRLLDSILEKPEKEEAIDTSNMKPIPTLRHANWNVKREFLEREDKKQAQILFEKNKEINVTKGNVPLTVEEIEKELGVTDAIK